MADDRLTICVELRKLAASQFGEYNFNSMCKHGNKLLGANEDGIFELDAADKDNGTDISAHFVLGPTDFGAEQEKRVRSLYVSGRLDGRLKMEMSGDEGEILSQELLPENNQLRLTHHKVSGGRDVRGKYLRVKVTNLFGSDFTISNINAVLVVLGQQAKEGV
jgi:hypothetical protein